MKTGRNDPCPCGSGKKFKKCCLAKQFEATPAFIPPASSRTAALAMEDEADSGLALRPQKTAVAPPPAEPDDPHMDAINACWQEFESRTYEGQVELYIQTLDDEELMDSEMAFSMLDVLYRESVSQADTDRFDLLARALRDRLPDIFEENAAYIIPWLISNALNARRFDDAHRLALELAPMAFDNLPLFDHCLEELAYHGQLSTLVEAMRIAWLDVREAYDVGNWANSDLVQRAVNFEILHYLERSASPNANDPELTERLDFYFEEFRDSIPVDFVSRAIDDLTAIARRQWNWADFDNLQQRYKSSRNERHTTFEEKGCFLNLISLTQEFLGCLRRDEGIPYSKGELGRRYLTEYFVRLIDNELQREPSMWEAFMGQKPEPSRHLPRKGEHVLIPDPDTMDVFLTGLTRFMVSRIHGLAATMEFVPAWLRFLESRQLIDTQKRIETLRTFDVLRDDVVKLLSTWKADPTLERNVAAAWSNEVLPAR